ncbi:MAG: RNA polymerase sigma factor [Nitrospira sp.]
MTTHSTHLAEAQLMASRDIPNVGSALRLTYGQIASLFQQYREELTRRLVGMVKSHETAADLVQDTYVRLLRLGDAQVVEQPRALLHRIAANLAIDHLRREKNSVQAFDDMDAATAVPSQAPSPERELLAKQRLRLCLQAIEQLPPRSREAFVLCRVYGYSYQEIAVRMGISESGVEKLLMRALDQTCEALEAIDRHQ